MEKGSCTCTSPVEPLHHPHGTDFNHIVDVTALTQHPLHLEQLLIYTVREQGGLTNHISFMGSHR